MMRTFTFSGGYMNAEKKTEISSLLKEYRSYTNGVLSVLTRDLFETGSLPAKYPKRLDVGSLSERYKQVSGAQAKDMIKSWTGLTKAGFKDIVLGSSLLEPVRIQLFYINKYKLWFDKAVSVKGVAVSQEVLRLARIIFKESAGKRPKLRALAARLDEKVATLEKSKGGEFDYWIRLSTLTKGKPIMIPIRSYDLFEKTKGTLKKIVQLRVKNGKITIGFVKEIAPKKKRKEVQESEKKIIGIDAGMTALITLSNGQQFGRGFFRILKKYDKALQNLVTGRQKDGLEVKNDAYEALVSKIRNLIKNEVGRCVNKVIALDFDVIVLEELKGISTGTKQAGRLSHRMRRLLSNCGIKRISDLLEMRQEEYGYEVLKVNPAYTSQECRECHHVDPKNRSGEKFKCRQCGLKTDANHNGAVNILHRRSMAEIGLRTPKYMVKELIAMSASRHNADYSPATLGLGAILDKGGTGPRNELP